MRKARNLRSILLNELQKADSFVIILNKRKNLMGA